jgi:hypothetical protein
MLLLWAVLLGLLVGFLRKGSLRNLASLKLQGAWLILIAAAIQLLIFPLGEAEPVVKFGTEYFHILSYVILVVFLVLNWRHWQLLVMGAGMISNFVVILLNGGYMPASIEALRRSGSHLVAEKLLTEGTFGNVMLLGEHTQLNFLGDVLYLPGWVPFAGAFSPGDLLLGLGVILFLGIKMKRSN